ncbi:hypothetical protein FIV42_00780 [Persicimonas caeni]|uniref:Uncharacterized protein n=1 Tax=Persicimonas caeni TaxID=2292766 RepID=A0A4Y6PM69_PERCE|nr:hypothetical protein [Persicimonas caeni]QDG49319.1 hypothetical protein FIV42_00780 [Persicimonas caeni]QED30540.1 hypothetical protein FRD00_00775 [Persicimonas caeni]
MRKIDVEAWARRVIDMVLEGNRVEDSRVELKAHFPGDHPHIPEDDHVFKHARQLAGHANAARGAELLWLFGLDDEAHCITDVATDKREHWYQRISSKFESLVPELLECLTIDHADGVVVAFYFGTERAPYLVNNPKGGRIDFEVPWREDNTTRTARRRDLVSVLVPVQRLPDAEMLLAAASVGRPKDRLVFCLDAQIYLEPLGEGQIVFPFHRIRLESPELESIHLSRWSPYFASAEPAGAFGDGKHTSMVDCRGHAIVLGGPTSIALRLKWFPTDMGYDVFPDKFDVTLRLQPSRLGTDVVLRATFSSERPIRNKGTIAPIALDISDYENAERIWIAEPTNSCGQAP